MKVNPHEHIQKITPYIPGKIGVAVKGSDKKKVIDLASNENPWGASPKAIRAMRSELSSQHRYPDPSCSKLRQSLSAITGLEANEIVIGNGSSDIIELLIKGYVTEGDEVLSSKPSFSLYKTLVQVHGGNNMLVDLRNHQHDLDTIKACICEDTRLIVLDNPISSTGQPIQPGALYGFLSEVPENIIVVLDEAYVDFMKSEFHVDVYSLVRNTTGRCAVVVLRTFSKLYGLAGIRVGYGLMSMEVAEVLEKLRLPFNVSRMAQAAALAALQDKDYYEKVVKKICEGRSYLLSEVSKLGFEPLNSQANFIHINLGKNASQLCSSLAAEGVLVRSLESFGLPESIRVSVGTDEDNSKFMEIFSRCVKKDKYV